MEVSKKALFLVSTVTALLLSRYAEAYTIRHSAVWTTIAIYTVLLSASSTWSIVLYPTFFSPLRDIPKPPGGSIFMGHFFTIMREPAGVPQRQWVQEVPNDGIIRYQFAFNDERVLLTSPKALAEVLVTKNYEFIKPKRLREGIGQILGIGILLAEGDEHRRQRKNLMPAFSFRHVKDLYPVFWSKSREVTEAMTKAIQEPSTDEKPNSVLEISTWASRVTLDIIGVAGMGQDFNAVQDPNNELYQTYRNIFSQSGGARVLGMLGFILPLWFLRALPVKRNQEVMEASKVIKRTAYDLIQAKKQKLEKAERTDVDILSVALESGGFTDEDLVNQLMTFLAAGHETTASSLTWAVYLLCRHPDVQRRLREEIRSGLPSINDPAAQVSSTDIDRLPYLNAVCNEVLRVFSPVGLTLRAAANDSTILGHFIPKDTTIIISPWAVNVSKELWGDDALEFNPERWLGPGRANTGGADSNYSFLTFLHGPRSCIGQGFAKAEFACLVAAWAGRFEMQLEKEDYVLEIGGGITSKPKGGLNVRLTAIEGW